MGQRAKTAVRRQAPFAVVFSFDPQPDPHRQKWRQADENFGVKNAFFEVEISLSACVYIRRPQVRVALICSD